MIGVDLFAGAGGMSVGATLAGVEVRLAIEADQHSCSTYARNHPDTKLLNSKIEAIRRVESPANSKDLILFGGPPCKGFSVSNQKTRNISNPSNWLWRDLLRFVRLLEPAWVVVENVTGILQTAQGVFARSIIDGLERCGYRVSVWVLNAEDYGVPQRRLRLFAIASRVGLCLAEPEKTARTPVTVYDAIGDLPALKNGDSFAKLPYKCDPVSSYARVLRGRLTRCANHSVTRNNDIVIDRFKLVPPGGNWKNIPENLMTTYADTSRCHTGIYRRLRLDRPSVVIGNFRKNMLIHPVEHRGLSVREAARLQSFPDKHEFEGSIGFQQQQVGNAVPPLLAKVVFERILLAHRRNEIR